MMRRIVGASSAIAAVSAQQRDHGFVMHLPKADIPLGKFNFSKQYNEFRNRSGRVPDFGVEKFRESFWRVDEYIRRSEKHLQEQGYFYLPTLEFPWYKGCLPLFSSYQLRVHYGRHHRAYVEKLNKLIEGTPYYGLELDDLILKSSKDAKNVAIFNNAAQHYNHCFFWKTITPHGSNMPPDLEQALNAQYGSMAEFKKTFSQSALNCFGSGWVYLVFDKGAQLFDIVSLGNAGCPLTTPQLQPLLCIDVWEHAYYVDYENDRAKYVGKFLECVDWDWAERGWKNATKQEYHEMKFS